MPTSVIASVLKESEDKAEAVSEEPPSELLDSEAPKEASCTVADLIEEEEEKEEETETTDNKEEAMEEDKVDTIEDDTEEPEEEEKTEEESKAEEDKSVSEGKEEPTEEPKADKVDEKRSQPAENKSAAELAYEWDDEGVEEEKPKTPKKETPKKSGKSAAVLKAEAEVTPGRKSSRTPKLTQKMLESQSQKNLKDPEPEESEEDEEGEESVDAIAKELEKSDSTDSKKSPKGKGSAKKGKKPAMEGEKSKEEWVDLIFGANGEKVMEGGKKKVEEKDDKKDTKAGEEGDDTEDFVPENDTPKTKRGGRPKKKGLDETCEGVGKMGSNMYFYDGGPYIDSDEEDDRIKDKKADSEPARKSSRANKGKFLRCNN